MTAVNSDWRQLIQDVLEIIDEMRPGQPLSITGREPIFLSFQIKMRPKALFMVMVI